MAKNQKWTKPLTKAPADCPTTGWPVPQSAIDQHNELTREAAEGAREAAMGAGILSRMVMWMACRREFWMVDRRAGTNLPITHSEAIDHWVNGTAQFGENAERQVMELGRVPMMDDSGDFKSRERNAGVEREDANLTPSQRVWKHRRARIAAWKAGRI